MVRAAALKLGLHLGKPETQEALAAVFGRWQLEEAQSERHARSEQRTSPEFEYAGAAAEEQRQIDMLFELRAIMDNNAVSEKVAKQLFMVLSVEGISGDASMLARKAVDTVLKSQYAIHTDNDKTWMDPVDAMKLALKLAGWDATDVDFTLTGDGRTMGVNSPKTTTYVALRLVKNPGRPSDAPKEKIIPLAILDTGEKYKLLDKMLQPLRDKLAAAQTDGFELGGTRVRPTFWHSGDMKWLLIVTGCSTAQHACLHCHCGSKQRGDLTRWWPSSGPR
jgi:hypothetical protein